MSLYLNKRNRISNTCDRKNDFKHKRWNWFVDEWVKETFETSNNEVSND
jgi:hypothetical protein